MIPGRHKQNGKGDPDVRKEQLYKTRSFRLLNSGDQEEVHLNTEVMRG